ncbi:MAG: hypothetical protein Q9219_005196 [cf. Caloplaca sp. 3 TL-2023]
MFYSETLLSKTGPLARVWLSANLERKLSKSHILQSNIENSVNAIVDQGQAPMALRLSGQLLLGVAFRPGNVDLPPNLNMPNPASLTVMDKISDPILPELDPSLLDFRPMDIDFGNKKEDPLNWTSQLFSDPVSIELGRDLPEQRPEYEDSDMDIDLDLDVDDGPSIEAGRNAPPPRHLEDDLFGAVSKISGHDGLTLDLDDEGQLRSRRSSAVPSLEPDGPPLLGDENIVQDDEDGFALPIDDSTAPLATLSEPRLERDTQSPLSSVRSSVERAFDIYHQEENEEPSVHQPHKAKRRRVIQADTDTTMSLAQIKAQQTDRSAILKPALFISQDPLLLHLTKMQQCGEFVSSVMGDGRSQGWAPELRGILSVEVVRKSGQLKRKRQTVTVDIDADEDGRHPDDREARLEIPKNDSGAAADLEAGTDADIEVRERSQMFDLAADDIFEEPVLNNNTGIANQEESENGIISPIGDDFDDTTAPLLHPIEQGAVSLGTQHAAQLLRKRFGHSGDGTQPPARSSTIFFQDMLPERTTSKADATKIFFELLVLATKDAVKVDQSEHELGGPMRIRGKQSLWGTWVQSRASEEANGQGSDMADGIAV